MLIINADDFGKDSLTSKAIVECFKLGFCSSTTIMANMPDFEEAAQMAFDQKISGMVGMHLNLTEGFPLTDGMKMLPRFCSKDGQFNLSRKRPVFSLGSSERSALAKEIKEQIRKCRRHGIKISHIDSHHHIHTELAIADVLIPIAREEGVPFVRLSRNCGEGIKFIKKIYKHFLNSRIRKADLAATFYFGSIEDFIFTRQKIDEKAAGSFEIMIHPHYMNSELRVDFFKNVDCFREKTRHLVPFEKALSFNGDRYADVDRSRKIIGLLVK